MKTSSKERTLQWINNQYKKNNISFSHKLQRPVGQWNRLNKSLLIHSLLTGIPVNPIYIVDEDKTIYTLDGSQRVSTCIDFLNDKFSLSNNTPDISMIENGEEVIYEIAGKKFSKLDEDVQNTLLACSLNFCTISEYTDDEVKEMFKRQNSGKPLNGKLLRVVYSSDEFSDSVFELANHSFIDKLMTSAQRKNGSDRDLIIQTLMLIMTNKDNDFTSFMTKDIDNFVKNHGNESIEYVDMLRNALDNFDENFSEIKVPVVSRPMILYSGYRVCKDNKSFEKFAEKVNEFLNTYDENEEYKQFTQSGTSASQNVRGRFDYWRNIIKEL